jgi:hypothetical protein
MKPIDLANFVPAVGLLCTVCGWGITKFVKWSSFVN